MSASFGGLGDIDVGNMKFSATPLSFDQQNAITSMLGKPETKNVLNPSYLENLSLESLVDLYEGKNLVLVSTKLWASILMQNAQWITSWLAPTIQSDQIAIETYSMHMNLVPYNLLPHGGVPRLITYSREKTLTSKVMYGLGFKVDMLVLKDPIEGPALMEWLVKQLSFCAMITVQMKIIAHLVMNAHQRVFTEARGKEGLYVEPDRAFAIETATYCVASQGREVFYNWIAQNASTVQGIDTVILWPGGKSWLNNSDLKKVDNLKSWIQLQDPLTKKIQSHDIPVPPGQATGGDINVLEIPNFRLNKEGEDYDPLKTVSTVGQFHEVRICDKQRNWTHASGTIYIFDFPARRFNPLRLVDAYTHSGFWNFNDPQNRGGISRALKELRDRENSNPRAPRGHVGDDYLSYKAKSLISLSGIDFRRSPTDGTVHKGPREQNMMLSWDEDAKKYFIAEHMGGLEHYVLPTKGVIITAESAIQLIGAHLKEPVSQVYDGLKKIIAEIEAEEYNEEYWKALVEANMHRIVAQDGNGYKYNGEFTPERLAKTHGVPQIMEFIPNTYGGLDLPGYNARDFAFDKPAGFGNAPGLRTIAAERSKPNTPYHDFAKRVAKYVEAADAINGKLEEFFMGTLALNPDYRPAHFHVEDVLTMALATIFPDRPPAFLQVPLPTSATGIVDIPSAPKALRYTGLTKLTSVDYTGSVKDGFNIEAVLPSGQTLVVPGFLYDIGFSSADKGVWTNEIHWLRIFGALTDDARKTLLNMIHQIYDEYEHTSSGEFVPKNGTKADLPLSLVNMLVSAIGYQCSVSSNFNPDYSTKTGFNDGKVLSLILSAAVKVIEQEAMQSGSDLAKTIQQFKVTNATASRTSFAAKIASFLASDTTITSGQLVDTSDFRTKFESAIKDKTYESFIVDLSAVLKTLVASKIPRLDLSSTALFSGEAGALLSKAGAENGEMIEILAKMADEKYGYEEFSSGKSGSGLSKTTNGGMRVIPKPNWSQNDAPFIRAPISVSPQLMRSIKNATAPVVLPGDIDEKYTKPIDAARIPDQPSAGILSIAEHFLKKRTDGHNIDRHPVARAASSQGYSIDRTDVRTAGRRIAPSTRTLFNTEEQGQGDELFISNRHGRTNVTKTVGEFDSRPVPRFSSTYIEAPYNTGSKAFPRAYDAAGEGNSNWRPDLAYIPPVNKVFRGPWADRIKDVNECTTDPLTRLASACYLFMPNNGVSVVNMVEKGLFPPFDACYWRLSMSNFMHDMIMTAGRGEAIVNYMSQPGVFMAPDNAHRDVLFYHLLQFAPYIKNPEQILLIRNVAPAGYIGGVNTRIIESVRDFDERANTRPSVIATLKPITELFADKMRFDGSPVHPSLTSEEESAIYQKYTWSNASFYGTIFRDLIVKGKTQEIESVKRVWYQRQYVLLAFRGPQLEHGYENKPVIQEGNGPRGALKENCPEACLVWEGLQPEFPDYQKVMSVQTVAF